MISQKEIDKLVPKVVELPDDLKQFVEVREGLPVFSHPFAHVIMYNNMMNANIIEMIESKTAYSNQLVKDKKWTALLFIVERPYRLEYLLKYKHMMTKKELGECISYAWVDCEFPHVNNMHWRLLFADADKEHLMCDEEDMAFYNALPDRVRVYRGVNKRAYRGISWTTHEEKARWFANRFHKKGDPKYLLSMEVDKDLIHCCYTHRSESECVIINNLSKQIIEKEELDG